MIVPPVLSKSGLVEQPVLRLVWSRAFTELATAHEVTFIGYSFPTTDIAVRTLFSEAMEDLPRENITIVNLASDESEADASWHEPRTAPLLVISPTSSSISTVPSNGFAVYRCSAKDYASGFPPRPGRGMMA